MQGRGPRVVEVRFAHAGGLCDLTVEGPFSLAAEHAYETLKTLYKNSPEAWKIESAEWYPMAPYVVWGKLNVRARKL